MKAIVRNVYGEVDLRLGEIATPVAGEGCLCGRWLVGLECETRGAN